MKPLYNFKVGNKVYMPSKPELGEGIVQVLHPQNSSPGRSLSALMAFVEWENSVRGFLYFSELRPTELPPYARAKRSGKLHP
jgi:hypothetical protein